MLQIDESQPDVRHMSQQRGFYPFAKRIFDIFFSLLAIFSLLPLLLILALIISMNGGRPIFTHARVGRDGELFYCLKFRTMVIDSEKVLLDLLEKDENARREWKANKKLSDDPRVTPFGRFLRRSSLDELPQFVNVILGQMSVVGPRPITAAEMAEYGDKSEIVTSVSPGVTGLWQVGGRNDLTLAERCAMDVAYVKRANFMLDLQIIWRTVAAVLRMSGQ